MEGFERRAGPPIENNGDLCTIIRSVSGVMPRDGRRWRRFHVSRELSVLRAGTQQREDARRQQFGLADAFPAIQHRHARKTQQFHQHPRFSVARLPGGIAIGGDIVGHA